MSNTHMKTGTWDEAGYEIRIKGHLGARWAASFDGLNLAREDDGTTVLHGSIVDQSALHGVLQQIRDLGLPLLSVTRIDADQPAHPPHPITPTPTTHTHTHEETAMRTTAPTTAATRVPMTPVRRTALVAGVFYLITFISIPTLALYSHLKSNPDFVLGTGSTANVRWGCVLEVIVALAGIGTAVTLYPVVKRYNESVALGFVAVRTLEAAMIFTGVVNLVSLITLRDTPAAVAGANAPALIASGASHVAGYNTTFLLGQTLMPCLSALLLGSLMYKSRLVPRLIPTMGLVGAPLLLTATFATLLGHNHPTSAWSALATLPVAAWEFSLGMWLVVKGFNPSPSAGRSVASDESPAHLIPA